MKHLIQDYVDDDFANKKDLTAIEMGGLSYSYQEMDLLSRKFANYLEQAEIKQGELIAILSPVLPETIAAMLGCLRQGVVYVPLNVQAPHAWLANIIQKVKIKHVLVANQFLDKAVALQAECKFENIIVVEAVPGIEKNHLHLQEKIKYFNQIINEAQSEFTAKNILADDLAYILYTSGSTGDPKGIMITHRNAYTFIAWMKKKFTVSVRDRILSRAPLQFDLSVFDIYTTFYAGATLVIKPNDFDEEPASIIELIEKKYITIIYTVPSAYIRLLTKTDLRGRALSLRWLLYAGEPFPPNYLHELMTVLPHIHVSNIYGPTETNIVTYYDMTSPPDPHQAIPLGFPAQDTEIIIVDENLKPLPVNEIGEIMVRGGTVFAGYFNQPELTKKRLIQSPFHQQPTMCCLTGDLGKILPNGMIAYHGRKDNMIKTRGYRVEIDEVENAISKIEGVAQATVVAKPHAKYSNILYAYVLLKETRLNVGLNTGLNAGLQTKLQAELTPEILLQLTAEKLPEYMLPYQFFIVEELPKTSTGKVDRVLLADMIDAAKVDAAKIDDAEADANAA
jgi:amino acid adenylation domain-containing protein